MSCIMYVELIFTPKKKIEKEHQKVISMVGAKIPLGSLVFFLGPNFWLPWQQKWSNCITPIPSARALDDDTIVKVWSKSVEKCRSSCNIT